MTSQLIERSICVSRRRPRCRDVSYGASPRLCIGITRPKMKEREIKKTLRPSEGELSLYREAFHKLNTVQKKCSFYDPTTNLPMILSVMPEMHLCCLNCVGPRGFRGLQKHTDAETGPRSSG